MIALEEKFLVNILYRPESEILNGVDINNINFEKLITLTSGHLMLPALFFNIQKKKAAYLFPEDFIDYIKGIYAINKARNEILLDEAKELSELLVEHNIKHFFLKGTALLLSNVFEDIGERMIGDIDFIIRHKDEEKIKNQEKGIIVLADCDNIELPISSLNGYIYNIVGNITEGTDLSKTFEQDVLNAMTNDDSWSISFSLRERMKRNMRLTWQSYL